MAYIIFSFVTDVTKKMLLIFFLCVEIKCSDIYSLQNLFLTIKHSL